MVKKSTETQTNFEESSNYLTEVDNIANNRPTNLSGDEEIAYNIAEQKKLILKYNLHCVLYQLNSQSEKNVNMKGLKLKRRVDVPVELKVDTKEKLVRRRKITRKESFDF